MRTGFRIIPLLVMLLLPLVFAPTSHAVLNAVGPIDAATTFPAYYQDSTGLSLAPCLDNNGFCSATMLSVPNLALPIAFPLNFPAEGFYFLADNILGTGRYRAALEFSGGPGAQITFARIRLTDKGAPLGTYTVTHPYGVFTVTVDAVNIARNQGLRFTEDLGLGGPPFTGALTGKIGPFLRTATGLVASPDGNVYVGNSVTPVAVTGTPITSVSIVPALPGYPSSLFSLEGKVIGMSITPTTIDFGTIGGFPAKSTPPITVTVNNLSSSGTLTIAPNGIIAQGADAAFFQIDPASPCLTAPVIPPAGTCTFNVTFGEPAAGPQAITARTGSIAVSGELATVPKVFVTPVTGIIDSLPPTIVATFPTTTSAPANVNMTLKFDKSMDPATINATTFTVTASGIGAIPGIAPPVYNDANRVASIALPVAQENVLPNQVITVQATTGMKDIVGNALASAVTFSFTATAPDHVAPTIATISPANNDIGVRTDGKISVTFSEPMLATSITASVIQLFTGGVAVDGTVTVDGAVATLAPALPLAFGTPYSVTITAGAQDLASNALVAGQSLNFVTNFQPTTPDILSPSNGATGVGRPVVLRWTPSSDQDLQPVEYHLFLCNNQAFIGSEPNCILNKTVATTTARAKGVYFASVAGGGMLFSLFGLSFAAGLKGRKKILAMIAVLFISSLFIISCSKSSDSTPAPVSTDVTFQVDGLSANVKYFWKVEANDGNGGVAATAVQEFTTQ